MIQAIVKKGIVIGENVPAPVVSTGGILIKVVNSCISAGTEMSGVASSGRPLIKRMIEQPEKLKKVIDMTLSEGISKTLHQMKGLLDLGKPTGYSISGIVVAVGEGIVDFKSGDYVAAAGGGIANHAEYVDVPVNLVVRIPEGLDFLSASSVTLGAIAMQGIRRAELHMGEYAVVVGCGILGLLSLQMLKNSGVRVACIDIDDKRLQLAKDLGAEIVINPSKDKPVNQVVNWTDGHGTDAVIFTAATQSSEPLSDAFNMCRRKGKVVLVGVSGMDIQRKDIYPKELDFLVSTSYGPGRYDDNYEQKGIDYPYAYVRWTENRNLKEYLRLLKEGLIKLDQIIHKTYSVSKVTDAFNALKDEINKPLMVMLDYGKPDLTKMELYSTHDRKVEISFQPFNKKVINIAMVGVGSFATNMHLPNIEALKDKYNIYAVVNRTGYKAKHVAKQYNAQYATTNYQDVLNDKNVDLVFICTRHENHAQLVLEGLKHGKHVFVEKPLATTLDDLEKIEAFYYSDDKNKPLLMTGFNRRFSKYAVEIKKHIKNRVNPLFIHYRMNAGYIPMDHWVHENGGRIVGEACHIIDLMTYFTESAMESLSYETMKPTTDHFSASDNKSIVIKYKDGSVATIEYFACGSKQFPKEYMEMHFDEKTILMEDYKYMEGYGINVKTIKTSQSQKGQYEELIRLHKTLMEDDPWPIELWDMIQTTRASLMLK